MTTKNAVLAASDASDGLKDGLLSDPRACRFDPGVLLCKAADDSSITIRPRAPRFERDTVLVVPTVTVVNIR